MSRLVNPERLDGSYGNIHCHLYESDKEETEEAIQRLQDLLERAMQRWRKLQKEEQELTIR